MRRFPSSPRHRLVARNPIVDVGDDDLSTWTSSAQITTMALPGTSANLYPLVVDVTKAISLPAIADTGALRFRHENGVRFAHKKLPSGRILLIGNFHGGRNTFNYYWGKPGAEQPGLGFPSADESLAGYRLGLLFDGGLPVDISPTPATFSIVGSPTFETYTLGQAMKFAEGSYIETTADKLRTNARSTRAIFASIALTSATSGGRIVNLANWLIDQRAMQLWVRNDGLEYYTSVNGAAFQRWTLLGQQKAGPNTIGASWSADKDEVILHCNNTTEIALPAFTDVVNGALFDTTEPYIIGGTKIPGAFFDGNIRCVFELAAEFVSENHFSVWRSAWDENEIFWGLADRTPDNIDVPEIINAPLSSEVTFARKEVTGITEGTNIAVYGEAGTNPTYSIGSAFSTPADIKAKGSSPGIIGPGDWISTYHTAAGSNSTVVETTVTVGTVTSHRRSTTIAASTTPTVPGGPATYTVNSVSALVAAFNSARGGEIIEVVPGDYKTQGTVTLQNRNFMDGPALEIRAGTLAYRGYLASEGGLMVPDETFFTTGSGGAEFSGLFLRNLHNVKFTGLRAYQGNVGTGGAKYHLVDCISCSNLTFENVKLCGYKPTTSKKLWACDKYRPNNGLWNQGRAMQVGVGGACSKITFKKCLIHWFGDMAFYNANAADTLFEDCVFSDQVSDHIRNDGPNDRFTARRCILYRTWGRKSSSGGVAHCDDAQNSSKDQPGWRNHFWEYCIFCPADTTYPHKQGVFMEHDNYPAQPRGYGVYITNCLFEGRAPNTIYNRPGDRLIVTKSMVLQTQFGGLNELNEDGNDSLIDTTFNSPSIFVSSTGQNGKSFGTNKLDRTIYYNHDFSTGIGDQILNSNQLTNTGYATELFDFPKYNGAIRTPTSGVPVLSAASWKPVLVLNSSYVFDPLQLKRWAPKANSPLHPNQKGQHHGCSELFQLFNALP